jgi:hypothetical protein
MSDKYFMQNVHLARECGADLVCAQCGMGMDDVEFDDPEMHEYDCPNRGRDRDAEFAKLIVERLGPEKAAELLPSAHGWNVEGALDDDQESPP